MQSPLDFAAKRWRSCLGLVSPVQGQQPTCRDREAATMEFTLKARVDLHPLHSSPPRQLLCKRMVSWGCWEWCSCNETQGILSCAARKPGKGSCRGAGRFVAPGPYRLGLFLNCELPQLANVCYYREPH